MQAVLIFQLLILLVVANGTPVAAKLILGKTFSQPLDGGARFGWEVGALIGTVAMLGDLSSSFIKRRMGLPASAKATGLDQIPESLFPLLACGLVLPLTILDVVAATILFFVGDLALSRLLFTLNLRERPY